MSSDLIGLDAWLPRIKEQEEAYFNSLDSIQKLFYEPLPDRGAFFNTTQSTLDDAFKAAAEQIAAELFTGKR